jgi:hypothetical protein
MAQYRKKPVVVEAVQFTGENAREVGKFLLAHGLKVLPAWHRGEHGNHFFVVDTIHEGQSVSVVVGDWIIPEKKPGRFYPVKPDIFEATYEKVEPYHPEGPVEGLDGSDPGAGSINRMPKR